MRREIIVGEKEEAISMQEQEQEQLGCVSTNFRSKLIGAGFIGLSLMNGTLYFLISVEGGENIIKFFDVSENKGNKVIYIISAGASLVYTMFTYKTLEALTLKPDTKVKFALSLLAPFSAVAFLTAGQAGALTLGCSASTAYALGSTLFVLRMINCIDASVKFPKRLLETKESWSEAYQNKNHIELARLVIVWLASIGYVLCTTDAIYNSMQIFSIWLDMNAALGHWLGISAGILGGLGTLPLNVYWTHRGLRQLTNGGHLQPDGSNPDPTDIYTFLGLILVLPVMLGILGGATASTGQMFGQLGNSANYIRIVTSLIYAACAGTPGMATLLRRLGQLAHASFSNMDATSSQEGTPLIRSEAPVTQQQESRASFFSPLQRLKHFFNAAEPVTSNDPSLSSQNLGSIQH